MTLNQQKMTSRVFKILLRIPVPWVFVLTYLLGVALQIIFPINIRSQEALFFIKILGIVLFLIAAIFAAWSQILFRKAKTTTTPGERSAKIITSGPYRLSRNPMYISLTLAYIGEAGLLAQAWPLLVLPLIVAYINWIVIPLEETLLNKDFGEDYKNYCAQVRRWL
jgi:protein-S-isoprenylcysteine O-methyltransferase Ste14